ncbi:hypothetical protein ACH4OW_26195 [Streptomyces sp. NPDC017056]|uniref:hypothetical protein n=1 Tax=Streptomyces sp. NPDC017056 TaxID=3364973 RepID=UPI0037A7E2AB
MKRTNALVTVLSAGVVALISCGAAPHGTVTGKEYKATGNQWTTEPQTKRSCSGTGAKRSCRTVGDGSRRVQRPRPECWEIELDTGDEICVSRGQWDKARVGQKW